MNKTGMTFLLIAFSIIGTLNRELHSQEQNSERVEWTTSKFQGTPDPPAPYSVQRVYQDVKLTNPTEVIRLPGTDRWAVVQMNGQILSFSKSEERDLQLAVDLKKSGPFMRAYGIAFHPEFPQKPWCYITYSAEKKNINGTRLSRYTVTNTKCLEIDPSSEEVLVTWSSIDHCGGSPKFGPDGYLYFSIGDGQRPNPPDPAGTGQDISDLQASVLRIDVDHKDGDLPYRIPEDNPFVNVPEARGEVWAFGVRNPWRIAFHQTRNELWAADVGWEMMEMVYRIDRGANYGWSVMEGTQLIKLDGQRHPVPITPPIAEYDHTEGRSITGGYFWQSDRIEALKDTYIYGDYQSGKIWGVKHDGEKTIWNKELVNTTIRIICYALDDDGEILVVGFDGSFHKINPNPALVDGEGQNDAFPRKLSETGLFSSTKDQTPAPGVMPYSINAHHWADHTTAKQWFAMVGDSELGIYDRGNFDNGSVKGFFVFPQGMVFAKTISYLADVNDPNSNRNLETQVLHKLDQDWRAYNYIWNDEQTDAVLQDNLATYSDLEVVDPNAVGGIRKQTWLHASRDQCMLCHIWRGGSINGFKVDQLNRSHGDETINQLNKLESLGFTALKLERPTPAVSPSDEDAPLASRARRYLDLNCGHCHRRGGGGSAPFVLTHVESLENMGVVGSEVIQGDFGIKNACVVSPHSPNTSVLLYRLAKSGPGQMPKFGANLIDDAGVRLIHDWIESMAPDEDAETNSSSSSVSLKDVTMIVSNFENQTQSEPINQLLSNTETALSLSVACTSDLIKAETKRTIAILAKENGSIAVQELFERFLPKEMRTKRLGPNIVPESLLALEGSSEEGRKLYFESSFTCRNCHLINGKGKMVGPDLSDIGLKRKPNQILQSILDPSLEMEGDFQGYVAMTLDGQIVSGLKGNETVDTISLIDLEGKVHEFAKDDIDEIRPMSKSIMPDRLLEEFTAQQAADLLAFLIDQKTTKSEIREK